MAEENITYISKITLPSGYTYNIKDQGARDAIAALEGGSYFLGTTTTALTDEATTNPITVGGNSVTATNGNMVIYGKKEFVFNGTKWLEFGDLSALNNLAYKDYVTLGIGSGDMVLGEATTFTNADSSVTFTGGTTDVVLGEATTFTSSTPTITVTPTTTNIKATASGTAVGANGTANAITSFDACTTDTVLGTDATFTTSVTPTTTNIKATASGTAVGADGTDTFVKSYPGASSKLVTTTITGTNGTDSATLVSDKVSKKLTTTSVPNVTSNANKTITFSMGTGNDAETLVISGDFDGSNTYTASLTGLGTAITCATGGLSNTSATSNVGDTVVASFSTTSKTLAKVASSSTTVATGGLDANGGGSSVMTGLGTATTASALTGVKVTTQPTVSLATGASAGTGVISVATGITSASTTVNSADSVTALTGLGTPTTTAVLTGVKVTTQPTVSLSTGATAGSGVISVATGITSATSTQPTITVGTNDKVTAVTGIGTGTAAAQTITVGTNDKVKVVKYGDIGGDDGISINITQSNTVGVQLMSGNFTHTNNTRYVIKGSTYDNTAIPDEGYYISRASVQTDNTMIDENTMINPQTPGFVSTAGYVTISQNAQSATIHLDSVPNCSLLIIYISASLIPS